MNACPSGGTQSQAFSTSTLVQSKYFKTLERWNKAVTWFRDKIPVDLHYICTSQYWFVLVIAIKQAPLDWTTAGFNSCIIGLGQSGTGKSATLLGPARCHSGLVVMLLKHLFKPTSNQADGDLVPSRSIGISMWEVVHDTPQDLLWVETTGNVQKYRPSGKNTTSPEHFECIEVRSILILVAHYCGDFQAHSWLVQDSSGLPWFPAQVKNLNDGVAVLACGKSRSSNWQDRSITQNYSSGLAHVFVKITLQNHVNGYVSTLHIVDLVGSKSLCSQGPSAAFDKSDSLSADVQGQRLISRQLLAFNKTLSDLAHKNSKETTGSGSVSMDAGNQRSIIIPALFLKSWQNQICA